jgi:O-antigen/teichoic acid export membrane protein
MAVIYPLTMTFGIIGTALSVLFGIFAIIPICYRTSFKIVKTSHMEILKILFPSAMGTGIMSLTILSLEYLIGQISVAGFMSVVLIGTTAYVTFLFFFWWRFQYGPIGNLQWLRQNL